MIRKKTEEPRITMEEFAKLTTEPIDWEQRRYEIAKDVLVALVAEYWANYDNIKGTYYEFVLDAMESYHDFNDDYRKVLSTHAVWQAESLVEILKTRKL